METDKFLEAYQTYRAAGSYAAAAKILNVDPRTIRRRVEGYFRDPRYSTMAKEAERTGTNVDNVSHFWLKTKNEKGDDVSLFVKNTYDPPFEELRDSLIESLKQYSPFVPRNEYPVYDDNDRHLLVVDPTDIHIGKKAISMETGGPDYGIAEAARRVGVGVRGVMVKAAKHNIDQIVLIVGNDVLHIDTIHSTTTKGTFQDSDGMWWQMFEAAREMYIDIINYLKQFAPVTLIYVPSNHDRKSGFHLADSIYSWFYNDENVTFSNYAKSILDRKYVVYGLNLIGITHGDQCKHIDLTSAMQFDQRENWGKCRFAYWYVHHLHHKVRASQGRNNYQIEKDHTGVTVIGTNVTNNTGDIMVEVVRTPSPPDGYHARHNYQNLQAIEAFIHHPTNGQVGRFTHFF